MKMSTRATKVAVVTKKISRDLLGLRRDMQALGRLIQAIANERAGRSGRRAGPLDGVSRLGAGRKRRRLTAADRERLKVQGEYLGLVRHLSARNRAKVKELRARRGYGSAIRAARRLGKGRS